MRIRRRSYSSSSSFVFSSFACSFLVPFFRFTLIPPRLVVPRRASLDGVARVRRVGLEGDLGGAGRAAEVEAVDLLLRFDGFEIFFGKNEFFSRRFFVVEKLDEKGKKRKTIFSPLYLDPEVRLADHVLLLCVELGALSCFNEAKTKRKEREREREERRGEHQR